MIVIIGLGRMSSAFSHSGIPAYPPTACSLAVRSDYSHTGTRPPRRGNYSIDVPHVT